MTDLARSVAVFDTVAAIGLPKEIPTAFLTKSQNIFGFKDTHLGEHIERAYHALALNETRDDFVSRVPQYVRKQFYISTSELYTFRTD